MINAVSKEDFHKLFDRGYKCIPVGEDAKGKGKKPLIKAWESISWDKYDPYDLVDEWFSHIGDLITGIGVLLGPDSGGLCCIDIDSDDQEIIERVKKYFPSPVSKYGGKGLTLFYKTDDQQSRNSYRHKVPSGGFVEVFYGGGRQIVIPPSWYSGEDKFYIWTGIRPLEDMDIDDLPILPSNLVENMGSLLGSATVQTANMNLPKAAQFRNGDGRTNKIGALVGGIIGDKPSVDINMLLDRVLDFDYKNFPSNSFFLDPRKAHNKTNNRRINASEYINSIMRTIQKNTGQFEEYYNPEVRVDEQRSIRFNQLNPVTEKVENMYEGMPEFDDELIPPIWRKMIEDMCIAQGTPKQGVFMAMFTALGGALQGNTIIKPFKDEKFFRRTNLGCVMVAYSGSKKSDIVNNATRELRKIDRELKKINSRELLTKVKDTETRIEALTKIKAKTFDDSEVEKINKEIFSLQDELENNKPKGTKFIHEDSPIQKMILDAKNNQDTGLFVIKDEMKQVFADFRKKGNEDARAFYMKGLDGNTSHSYSTISRGDDYIENLFISMLSNIQPDVLNAYIKSLYGASGENDGFIQRFILVPFGEPQAVKPTKFNHERYAPEYDVFRKAFHSPKVTVHIAPECEETYNDMRFEIRTRSTRYYHLPVSGFLNKHEGLLSVIAYLYEFMQDPTKKPEEIGFSALNQAIKLLTYLGKCAMFLFNIKDHSGTHDLLGKAAELFTKHVAIDGMTQNELFRQSTHITRSAPQFYDLLRELEVRGYCYLEKVSERSMIVHVNPEVYDICPTKLIIE